MSTRCLALEQKIASAWPLRKKDLFLVGFIVKRVESKTYATLECRQVIKAIEPRTFLSW